MNKKDRLILVDGSAYIFRAYYGLPPMNRADGTPINAVFGFTNMLVKLIEDYGDDKMIVIFDAARANFRNEIYPEYKANRGEAPEDLIPQFPLIRECVKSFNIPQLEIEGFEADDLIATYVNLAEKDKIETIIVSSDKDLMQLVSKNVTMLDPMKNKKIEIKDVKEKFGIYPENFCLVRSFVGDASDNIKGIKGAGFKSLVKRFPEINENSLIIEDLVKIAVEKSKSSKLKLYSEIAENPDVPIKNWKLMSLGYRNLSAFQVEKINHGLEKKNDKRNKLNFIKEQGKIGIINFDVERFFMSTRNLG